MLRQSSRGLLRTPSFTVIALVTLSLGIGATTAVYTVLETIALRPLAYRASDELVSVLHPATVPGTGEAKWGLSAGGYFHFRKASRTLEDLGCYTTSSMTVTGEGGAEQVRVGQVTASIFTTLQARAALGRLIGVDDDLPGQPAVVVLSHEFWRVRFGSDPNVVGTMLQTTGGAFEIIGVAEPGLTLPKPGPFASVSDLASFGVALWIPLQLDPAGPFYNSHQYSGIGRLVRGATVADAQAELSTLMQSFTELMPQAYSDRFIETFNFRVAVTVLRDEVLGPSLTRTLWVLFAAVALVLLIACANVANLFIVRMNASRRETAVRATLGATRRHLALHHMSEALILSFAAAGLGLAAGYAGLRALLALAPASIPRLSSVQMHATTIVLACALALVIGTVFGLLPLLHAHVVSAVLREGGRGLTASRRQRRLRDGLLIGQVALALVLLTAAGLLLRSFGNLRNVRPGLDPRGVLVFQAPLSFDDRAAANDAALFHRELQARILALPGVQSMGHITGLPLQDYTSGCTSVSREGRRYAAGEVVPCVATPYVAPGLFEALGIEVQGRLPTWADVNGPARVAVVTRALADRLWPGEDPIGKGVQEDDGPRNVWPKVIGVVPELRAHGLDRPPTEALFLVSPRSYGTFIVRVRQGDPAELIPSVRRIVAELDPNIPIVNPTTMQSVLDRSMARTSFLMTLLAVAGGMALLLSAVGIYGAISYMVALRRTEIGVRLALGARSAQVAGMIVTQSLRLVLAGTGIGLIAALIGTRVLRALLFEVDTSDPGVLVAATVVLLGVAGLAAAGPARRAAAGSAMEALRT